MSSFFQGAQKGPGKSSFGESKFSKRKRYVRVGKPTGISCTRVCGGGKTRGQSAIPRFCQVLSFFCQSGWPPKNS
jgi:hypothetical protein